MKRRALGVATSLVATVVLVGCSSETAKSSGSTDQDELLGHVHGLGTDPADGTLYVASHMGVFRRQDEGRLERVADRWQDTMAFTVVGPGHFIASGHPDLREDLPPQLGLIESTDAAETWRSLSLQGRADFHALDVSSDLIYGYDSANGALLKTLDGRRWQVIDRGLLADIAADPSDSSRLLATTPQGQLLAYDVPPGTSRRVEGAPPLYLTDWVEGDSVVGVSAAGELFLSRDGGTTWQPLPRVTGEPQALDAEPGLWHLATTHGIYRSTDEGRTWENLLA